MTFPKTTSVESDFSILKWEKDDNRASMIDLMLERIFQCNQMNHIPILLAPKVTHPCITTINDTFLPQGHHNHKNPWTHNFDRGGAHKLAIFV
jgi:hypothetical protein